MTEIPPRDRMERIGATDGRAVYYDDRRETYHTWYDNTAREPVSSALLSAVSAVLGVEPTDLEALYECVDPDALNRIFVHWRGDEPRIGSGSVSFRFSRCAVTVHADGEIVIDPIGEAKRADRR